MFGDVLLEFLHHECVDHLRRIVRSAFLETLVELQAVATDAVFRVRDRRHVRARRDARRRHILRRRGIRFRLRGGETPRRLRCRRTMAILAIELHRPVWPEEICFQMDGMVELHRAGVPAARAQGGKLRLSNIRPEIYEVFAITKLNKLFDIKDDEADALASF